MGALDGIRVIEFSIAIAGPTVGKYLAYHGAEVIKVESRANADSIRRYISPREPEKGVQLDLSPWFDDFNLGKRSLGLNLAHPDGVALVKRLVARCAVLVANYSARVLEKYGLDYETLRGVRPDLIYLTMPGFGMTGPYREFVAAGPNLLAMTGLSWLSGHPDGGPIGTGFAYPDFVAGLTGFCAVLAALHERRASATGQFIDLAQYEAAAAVIGPALMDYTVNGRVQQRLGNRSPQFAPHNCYPCAGDDRWCVIVATNDEQWRRLCAVAERPDWAADPRFTTVVERLRHVDELDAALAGWTGERSPWEVVMRLQQAGVPAGVVQDVVDIQRDPQLAARGFWERRQHAKKGAVQVTGHAIRLSGTPGGGTRAAPIVGEDNAYVLGELIGLTPDEIAAYVEQGVVEPPDLGAVSG